MTNASRSLGRRVDRDIYQIIRKYIDEGQDIEDLTVSSIYQSIQRSNSSLKRRPKVMLEDSIDRALDVIKEDAMSVSDGATAGPAQPETHEDPNISNAMNRSIVRSWQPKRSEVDHSTIAVQESDGQRAHDSARKRHTNGKANGASRPSKRSKVSRDQTAFSPPTHVSFDDLGGMDNVIEEFTKHLMLPLKCPQRYVKRGLKLPRGILLHGPPGCGKTMLCEAVAAELGLPFLQISAPSIVSGMSGESEKQLRQHFETALEVAPCLMFIDEIDAITPKRESAQREMERRIVSQLLTCMDSLEIEKTGGKPVIVIAATNRPDSLDPALRRAGRFDTEINIGVPNEAARERIMRAQARKSEIRPDVDFQKLAKLTPGFVGADLESLLSNAGAETNSRYLQALKLMVEESNTEPDQFTPITFFRTMNKMLDEGIEPREQDDAISMQDYLTALPLVQPSAKREGFTTIPDTTWSDIGALKDVRQQLQLAIIEPISKPEKYRQFGITNPDGVLLWGPPGCGKTLLAKAVANESRANFISVRGPEIMNKYVGESEKAIRQIFVRAQSSIPVVVFMDEIDALVPKRDDSKSESSIRVVNTLLAELDGMGSRDGIYIIAATNRPEMIDPAILRPGRLGKNVFVGLPGPEERVEILSTLMKKSPIDPSLVQFAKTCSGFSGADLGSLLREAVQSAIQRDANVIEHEDLIRAAQSVRPSVNDLSKYEALKSQLFQR